MEPLRSAYKECKDNVAQVALGAGHSIGLSGLLRGPLLSLALLGLALHLAGVCRRSGGEGVAGFRCVPAFTACCQGVK